MNPGLNRSQMSTLICAQDQFTKPSADSPVRELPSNRSEAPRHDLVVAPGSQDLAEQVRLGLVPFEVGIFLTVAVIYSAGFEVLFVLHQQLDGRSIGVGRLDRSAQ